MASLPHGSPTEGMTCACCWDDIDATNYVEYLDATQSAWLPSGYCQMCIGQLLSTQWNAYVSALAKTTCKAEQRRLLARGPPINLRDPKALPCAEEGEVQLLWYMAEGAEKSAKLEGSLEGEEREKFFDEQKKFYIQDEPDEEEGKETGTESVQGGGQSGRENMSDSQKGITG